ncbi:MAG: hypothetical protein KC420_19890 [Myxococcales bacterium]|nr:hypothetical protein [Myxococcales bacterium]MCB9567213.1 hypothetical protein [Myxococcales bacterium]MCB9704267.1 hypothetical protein [Myxococcales bacterium]
MVNNCDFLCLQLQDANMMILDGFCSKECASANDCVPAPQSKGTVTCIAGVGYCAISCTVDADCPIGMTCEGVNINNMNQYYCW